MHGYIVIYFNVYQCAGFESNASIGAVFCKQENEHPLENMPPRVSHSTYTLHTTKQVIVNLYRHPDCEAY